MTDVKKIVKRTGTIICALVITGLIFLFFTNDFGLVDLRKTSVVVGVGLDRQGEELTLTAQIALPQAAENGEKTQYNCVTGKGVTVAEALNEINVRTGFYPKLVFCELILLGESVLDGNLFATLDYFYRNEYTGLTPIVAACEGSAQKVLSAGLPLGASATDSIMRLLSEEAERSANVRTVNLKDLGEHNFSAGAFCYMPYISFDKNGESKDGGNGSSQGQGGADGGSGSSQGQGGADSGNGGSQGQDNADGGSSGSQGQGGGKSTEQGEEQGFLCNRCALFSGGEFVGLLDEELTFAFNLISGNVRHAIMKCGGGENVRVVSLRDCKGGAKLTFVQDAPVLKIDFSAIIRVFDGERNPTPRTEADKQASQEDIELAKKRLSENFTGVFNRARALGCDLFDVRGMLYRKYNARYEGMKDYVLDTVRTDISLNLRSAA